MQGKSDSFFAGLFIFLGLSALGYLLATAAIEYRQFERSVTVKGLAERELAADTVIWPIQFTVAADDLGALYESVERGKTLTRDFLLQQGLPDEDISFSAAAITDKSAESYGNTGKPEYRFTARQTVSVYSRKIEAVRAIMVSLAELGKQGIAFTGDSYQSQTEYVFTRLNDVKPEMIEEATRNARAVAEKFAADSQSKLGKIRRASQGQFSIRDRDKSNPHLKTVRVVTTVEYYLSD